MLGDVGRQLLVGRHVGVVLHQARIQLQDASEAGRILLQELHQVLADLPGVLRRLESRTRRLRRLRENGGTDGQEQSANEERSSGEPDTGHATSLPVDTGGEGGG